MLRKFLLILVLFKHRLGVLINDINIGLLLSGYLLGGKSLKPVDLTLFLCCIFRLFNAFRGL